MEDGVHEEACGREDEGVTTIPTGDGVCLAVNDKQDEDEEDKPDDVLAHFRQEIGAVFQLTSKRADEERSIDLPVSLHTSSLQVERLSLQYGLLPGLGLRIK